MSTPSDILALAFQRASHHIAGSILNDPDIIHRLEFVCRNIQNRAGARLLLACLLAKVHKPSVDIRKPYTEIKDSDCYSGRTYDEYFISAFITQYDLPCNSTTAFLTPALRNRNITLTPEVNLVGKPPKLYQTVLQLLTDVHTNQVSAENLLADTVRCLLVIRDERRQRMQTLLAGLKASDDAIPLSAEAIVGLISQHLHCRNSSRLPVLIVAAAYQSASEHLGERVLPLESHNAADEQTGALGDLEITLIDDSQVITSYEMKTRRITQEDIDRAIQKINNTGKRVENYIFVTTDVIDERIKNYTASIYERTGGIEFVALDCISFLRHFLHLFHRLRMQFLEAYQELVLEQSESAVSQPLKEAFLALRQAAESGE
ncbi:restriction endonuclease, SacI family [Coleofasciculus sp. H7-2]|uniref:restriction endonuclease, SacI family n=1 Tax=Coleofasciculus sp. H7-2 TaxID=3351545 RepID=UPI0036718318